jgi:hypothetical protein
MNALLGNRTRRSLSWGPALAALVLLGASGAPALGGPTLVRIEGTGR